MASFSSTRYFSIVDLLRGDRICSCEFLISSKIWLHLCEHRPVVGQLRFGLIELRLIDVALDAEELRSFS